MSISLGLWERYTFIGSSAILTKNPTYFEKQAISIQLTFYPVCIRDRERESANCCAKSFDKKFVIDARRFLGWRRNARCARRVQRGRARETGLTFAVCTCAESAVTCRPAVTQSGDGGNSVEWGSLLCERGSSGLDHNVREIVNFSSVRAIMLTLTTSCFSMLV